MFLIFFMLLCALINPVILLLINNNASVFYNFLSLCSQKKKSRMWLQLKIRSYLAFFLSHWKKILASRHSLPQKNVQHNKCNQLDISVWHSFLFSLPLFIFSLRLITRRVGRMHTKVHFTKTKILIINNVDTSLLNGAYMYYFETRQTRRYTACIYYYIFY